jgi:hypothetical protein
MDVLHESFNARKENTKLWESSKPRLEVLEIMEGWLKILNDKWDEIPKPEYGDDFTDEEYEYWSFLSFSMYVMKCDMDDLFPETEGKPSRKKAYLESLWEKAFDRE